MQHKRIYAFAIGALLFGTLSACAGANTSAAPAVSKGTEQMIATAAQPAATAGQTLRESLGAPATVEETSLPTKLDKFSISISADVSVPDTDHLSVYRVSAAEFSREFISKAFNSLCAGQTMYDFSNLTNTKEQVQGRIDSMQRDLDQNDSPNGSNDTDDSWRAEYETELAALKAQLPSAPEDLGTPIRSTQFSQQDAADGGVYEAFLAVNAPKYPFTVELFAWNNVKQTNGEEKDDSAFAQRSEATFSYHDTRRVSSALLRRRDVTNEPQINELEKTPVQAKEQAASLLKTLGITDMEPFRVTVSQEFTEGKRAGQFAYYVEFRRVVNGVEVQSPFTRTYVGSLDGGQEWAYETLGVSLDDEGILGMSWLSPLAVGATEVERATLLPFESILTVARNMLGVVNEPHEGDLNSYSAYKIEIDHITLSLQRISDVDSVQNGLLIPVWNFYGTQHYLLPDGTEQQRNEDDPVDAVDEAFLSVNAIDGSVVSKTQGF